MPILLAYDDGCPNTHYSKVVHETDDCGEIDVPRKGHSLLCFLDNNCKTKLKIVRSAFAHYSTLRSLLHAVYVARNSHLKILKLEQILLNGDISALLDASSVSFDNLFSTVEEHVQDISNIEKPDFEMRLRIENAEVFIDYQKAVDNYPKNVCCSCQQLYQKKNATMVRFDDHLGTAGWPLLKTIY